MTIRIPQKSFVDRILALFGKKREIIIDGEVYKKYGPYITIKARKNGLIKTLFKR